jgi:hypothetical protein
MHCTVNSHQELDAASSSLISRLERTSSFEEVYTTIRCPKILL